MGEQKRNRMEHGPLFHFTCMSHKIYIGLL